MSGDFLRGEKMKLKEEIKLDIRVAKGTSRRSWTQGFFAGLQAALQATGFRTGHESSLLSVWTECCGRQSWRQPGEFPLRNATCPCGRTRLVEWREV